MTHRLLVVIVSLLIFGHAEKTEDRKPRQVYHPTYPSYPSPNYYVAHPAVPVGGYPWFSYKPQPPVSPQYPTDFSSFERPVEETWPLSQGQGLLVTSPLEAAEEELNPSNMELGLLQTWEMDSIRPFLNKPKRPKDYIRRPTYYPAAGPSNSLLYTVVLKPGDEIVSSLRRVARKYGLKAAYIITCVAGINEVTLRYALDPKTNKRKMETIHKDLEVISLTGTVAADGSGFHLHTSLYDEKGNVIAGHVAGDMVVSVTAEIVIGEALGYVFTRRVRPEDGVHELEVNRRRSSSWPY